MNPYHFFPISYFLHPDFEYLCKRINSNCYDSLYRLLVFIHKSSISVFHEMVIWLMNIYANVFILFLTSPFIEAIARFLPQFIHSCNVATQFLVHSCVMGPLRTFPFRLHRVHHPGVPARLRPGPLRGGPHPAAPSHHHCTGRHHAWPDVPRVQAAFQVCTAITLEPSCRSIFILQVSILHNLLCRCLSSF